MSEPRSSVNVVYDSDTEGDGLAGQPWTKLDAIMFWPHEGYDEDVRMRVYPMHGGAFDIFLNAEKLIAAVREVVPSREAGVAER